MADEFDKDEGDIWDSADIPIPLREFMKLFNLTEKETRREGIAARFVAIGIKDSTNTGYSKVAIRESEAQRWIVNRNLPPRIRAKVRLAGGLAALQRWRNDYIDRITFDIVEGAIILPDGTRLTHVRFKEAPAKN